jgi:uncharacterized protein YbjT (DUF2867 family)
VEGSADVMSRCLIMGATGYIGTRLVSRLVKAGHDVHAMVRTEPAGSDLAGAVTIVEGDATNASDVSRAVDGMDIVFYLVHSLSRHDFAEVDRIAARILASASSAAAVGQIVYLGGARPADGLPTSEHLESRAEVGDILAAGVAPALVLQASMIIGDGSVSFELLRQLAEKSPLLPRAQWMARRSSPIAADDVLHYLAAAADLSTPVNGVFDINGPETLTYSELVQRCARTANRPWRIPVPAPLWSHELSAQIAGLFTTVPSSLARPLLRSLEHDLDSADHRIAEHIADPPDGLTSVDQAMRAAHRHTASTVPPETEQQCYVDSRSTPSTSTPDELWDVITGVGGEQGWHTWPLVWELRGALDHLLGGIGLHRGRPANIRPGDTVDFWTVEERDDNARRLVLRADMKMPGTTTLTMSAVSDDGGDTRYQQTIRFWPHGATGHLYWLLQKPAHDLVFSTMARNIARHSG